MSLMLHATFGYLREDPLILALLLCTVATALSLLMLPRMKGMIVGYQWAKEMNSFGRPRG
jgi:uncharacterized protein (DUF983 family)